MCIFLDFFFIRRGLAAYQKNGFLPPELQHLQEYWYFSFHWRRGYSCWKKVPMSLLRDEVDKRLTLSEQSSATFGWEKSLFLIHLKVATYNFSTVCSGKQTIATSDTPTASGCRPFHAISLSPVPSVLELVWKDVNPLNPELNPICYLLALLAQNFLHVSRIRVKSLTLRLLMAYIYIYIYIYIYMYGTHILAVSRSHTTTHHSR